MRPPESVAGLLKNAEKILSDVEKAHVFTSLEQREYPTFDPSEVEIGDVLGVGGFGVVSEVSAIKVKVKPEEAVSGPSAGVLPEEGPRHSDSQGEDADHDNDDHYELNTAKEKMARRCIRYGQARYAIKKLDPMLSELDRTRGMIDMALEVKYLTVLWHPNIGE